jgi:hypothetical protein
MGIFSAILDKLRGHTRRQARHRAGEPPAASPDGHPGRHRGGPRSERGHRCRPVADGVEEGRWRQLPRVDRRLLKLLDLDSSMNARKELAQELNVHAGEHGSAEQNIALHKAVMKKVAENGGKVPDSMKH